MIYIKINKRQYELVAISFKYNKAIVRDIQTKQPLIADLNANTVKPMRLSDPDLVKITLST